MDKHSLFQACTTQCEWCAARWPLTHQWPAVVHVAPFTKDPNLFSWPCEAQAVRKGFKYFDYQGGPAYKFKRPPVAKLLAYRSVGAKSSPANRSFWRAAEHACLDVSYWPAWQRSYTLSGKAQKETDPVKDRVRHREVLFVFDALESIAREMCTDGHSFKAGFDKSGHYYAAPTCNGGVGCASCWAKQQAFEDRRERESPCVY